MLWTWQHLRQQVAFAKLTLLAFPTSGHFGKEASFKASNKGGG